MLTRETAIKTAAAFIQSCASRNIAFEGVTLFGSAAMGTATDESDIDLLLVHDQFGQSAWQNAKSLAPINKYFSIIDARPFPTDYCLPGDPFMREIQRTGTEITYSPD